MIEEMKKIAYQRRMTVLDMVYKAKAGHLGSSMSCMDILVCLYYSVMDIEKILKMKPNRDFFILSKGHCAEALYAVLQGRGFFDVDELNTFTQFGTRLAEHPTAKVPGVEFATGSLGHGLSVGVGMALGNQTSHVFVLTGDGEHAEGTVWEAAMAAAKFKLDNLTCIVDRNRLQISGDTEDVMPLSRMEDKYQAFGWKVRQCDGHNYTEIIDALHEKCEGRPTVVIANTTKGKGSRVTEGIAEWHHRIPSDEQYRQIKADLEERRK